MPDDILDAAQKATDNATTVVDTGVAPLPPEPAPEPMVPSAPPAAPEDATKLVESILETKNPEPVVAPPAPSQPPKPVKTKRAPVAVIALLLLVFGGLVGAGAYFVSQRNQIADDRSKAAGFGCITAYECSDNGKSCGGCTKWPYYRSGQCCNSAAPGAPTITPPPGPIIKPPCLVCVPTNGGKCVNNPVLGTNEQCNSAQNECRLNTNDCKLPTLNPCEEAGRMCVKKKIDATTQNVCYYPTKPTLAPTYTQSCLDAAYKCVPEGSKCEPNTILNPTRTPTPPPIPAACANVGCSGSSCSVPASLYGPTCYVNHWVCDTVKPSGAGCSDTLVSTSRTANFTRNCGTEQIDIKCTQCGFSGNTNNPRPEEFVSKRYATNCSPGNTPNPPQPSRTPTQPANPVCLDIRIFKGGSQVTDLTSLRPNDAVVFYVRGSLAAATKARFRVNGATWTETTTKNEAGGWFILNYTIPEGVAQFVIEGEVFMGGAWH